MFKLMRTTQKCPHHADKMHITCKHLHTQCATTQTEEFKTPHISAMSDVSRMNTTQSPYKILPTVATKHQPGKIFNLLMLFKKSVNKKSQLKMDCPHENLCRMEFL